MSTGVVAAGGAGAGCAVRREVEPGAGKPGVAPTAAKPGAAKPGVAKPGARDLISASGGPRYAVALTVDAIGTGLLRPFLLIYGVKVLNLSAPAAGAAMTAGIVAGLAAMPAVGRWLDRGVRSAVVATAMAVRVIGTVLLLTAPARSLTPFAVASLFLGIGNQAFPAAHAAVVATVAQGRLRDAALAAGRALRNAALGIGALLAAVALAGGTGALRGLAAVTGVLYLGAALLAGSVRIRAGRAAEGGTASSDESAASANTTECLAEDRATCLDGSAAAANIAKGSITRDPAPATIPATTSAATAPPHLRTLLTANIIYAFCLNVPEIALPLLLVSGLHASPAWSAGVFLANTVLVVALQVPLTVRLARFSRATVLATSGLILTGSYVAFAAATPLPRAWAIPAMALISVPCTLGEIVYAGSATALVAAVAPPARLGRALARFQLSSGFGLAVSPAVMTALAAVSPAALWGALAAGTAAASLAVRNQFPDDRASGYRRPDRSRRFERAADPGRTDDAHEPRRRRLPASFRGDPGVFAGSAPAARPALRDRPDRFSDPPTSVGP